MLLREIENYYKQLLSEDLASSTLAYRRNCLKEFLHRYILDFLYKDPVYNQLIFYGGTCLRHCFNLPRLSEDLTNKIYLNQLSESIQTYFETKLKYNSLICKTQKFRIYLKLPILKELGIATEDQSDYLHLKIEINSVSRQEDSYKTEIQAVFTGNNTFFIKRYDLETLMASKINAVIHPNFIHHHNKTIVVEGKGRDYFDLLWYMQKKYSQKLNLQD